ncbi:TetR/AcrR family transcriptional regulator [Amycolatopsis viridis]|uniref:AcrR family transcriptional regulator n=1 Tax=Amycolatopsis viridis TaxID=185678 RepID=A0ABX0SYN7_9PSEU|nr:TetR/AcrR family transcriptional regulator [Amycolatopsis viridis]NIH82062.1 AcrR family transcriptional regulator [Amycolatopsis viridis]
MMAPRPMRADARRNYERLLATAREAFREHGPDAPLDDIARRAGVGAGTLYRHFPNREALIEAVYRDDIERLCAGAHQLLAEHEPGKALELWMRDRLAFVLQKRGVAHTLKAAMDRDSETFAYCRSLMNDAAEEVLRHAQEAGAVRADVQPRDLLLLGHGVCVAADEDEELAGRLLSVMLDGLKPQPA